MNDDVITVGNLIESLKDLDPSMWACVTVEGHVYPMTICNVGVLEPSNGKDNTVSEIFFLDVARQSFVKFVEKEIIDPLMQQAALEQNSPIATLQ